MTKIKIPMYVPDLSGNEMNYVKQCIASGWVSSKGAFIERFEHVFAQFVGSKYAVSCANGTVALHLALLGLGIGRGDEVIIPDLTFVASANAVSYTRARPVLVDVDETTWTIDTTCIEKAMTKKTKAIIPVHLYGNPCNMEKIMEIANRNKLFVIEDAAEAHGAEVKIRNPKSEIRNSVWKKVGSIGDIGCFSFYGNKIITTGEGGMVATNDKTLADQIRILRDHGQKPGTHYYHEVIGYNYRMTNLQAAVGVAQMERVESFIAKKREIANWYRKSLSGIKGIILHPEIYGGVYWMYSICIQDDYPLTRDNLIKLLISKGVEVRPFFYPVTSLPMYKDIGKCVVAKQLSKQGINLPSYVGLNHSTVQKIIDIISDEINK